MRWIGWLAAAAVSVPGASGAVEAKGRPVVCKNKLGSATLSLTPAGDEWVEVDITAWKLATSVPVGDKVKWNWPALDGPYHIVHRFERAGCATSDAQPLLWYCRDDDTDVEVTGKGAKVTVETPSVVLHTKRVRRQMVNYGAGFVDTDTLDLELFVHGRKDDEYGPTFLIQFLPSECRAEAPPKGK